MHDVALDLLVDYCDGLLRLGEFRDWEGAVNGLQVQNSGRVAKIAAAVDARGATLRLAAEARAQLLIVHHGLFWSASHPWTGHLHDRFRLLLDHDLAVYSAHLPLDAHPRIGNSILLARALGLTRPTPFFEAKGRTIGYRAECRIPRDTLVRSLAQATGSPPVVLPFGPNVCRRVGVVTGGAGAELREAAREGIDTFVTGEGPHWTSALAEDLGINVLYGGHYATETFGVKALAARLSRRFRIPWEFIDFPTGL